MATITLTITDDATDALLLTQSFDSEDGLRCTECGALPEGNLDDYEASYECSRCGDIFVRSNSADGDSSRCPNCNVFSAKYAEHTCPECENGGLEIVQVFMCPFCDDPTAEDELEAHFTTCTA